MQHQPRELVQNKPIFLVEFFLCTGICSFEKGLQVFILQSFRVHSVLKSSFGVFRSNIVDLVAASQVIVSYDKLVREVNRTPLVFLEEDFV